MQQCFRVAGVCSLFFWAKLNDLPNGITFHEVDTDIDTGRILVQVKYPPSREMNISMLRFYIDVFVLFPELAVLAIDRLIAHEYMEPLVNVESSYFSLPKKPDYDAYRKKSFRICGLSDLFYQPSGNVKALLSEIYKAATQT
jgi:hypothetical protein